MADKKPTHVVKHRRLFLMVDGKLTHMPQGTNLELTAKQAAKLGAKVALISDKTVDMKDTDEDIAGRAKAEEALAALKAEHDTLSTTSLELTAENEKLKEEIEALKAAASKPAK